MRIDAARSHLIRANLCRLHEPVVDAQRGNAIFFAQGVGAVNDVLLCSGDICLRGLLHGLCLRRRYRRFAGVRLFRFDLYTFGIAVPIDIEADRSADVAQHNIVIAVDVVRRQADFLPVYKDAVCGKRCFQRFHRLRCRCAQCQSEDCAAEDETDILHSFHGVASFIMFWYAHHITSKVKKSNRTDPAKRRKNQVSTAVTHQRWSRWLRTQV